MENKEKQIKIRIGSALITAVGIMGLVPGIAEIQSAQPQVCQTEGAYYYSFGPIVKQRDPEHLPNQAIIPQPVFHSIASSTSGLMILI